MARAAGFLAEGGKFIAGLRRVMWVSPIVVGDEPISVQLRLNVHGERIEYEVVTEKEGALQLHSRGELIVNEPFPNTHHLDFSALEASLHEQISAETLYQTLAHSGFTYGPRFRALKWLKHNNHQVLGYWELPSELKEGFDRERYVLHPSILDAALQSVFALSEERGQIWLPFAIEELSCINLCQIKDMFLLRACLAQQRQP